MVSQEKIILPLLRIKLGPMKQFVEALNKNAQSFHFIFQKFRDFSTEKLKVGIFDGPQNGCSIKDTTTFEASIEAERNA